jgi:ribosomal protein L40E
MREIPAEISKDQCACGARRPESGKQCRKCSARSRWYRRKAWRSSKTPADYLNGKK